MLYRHLLLKDKINGIVWKVRIVSGELILDSTTYINAMSDFVFQDKTNPSVYWKLIIENGELLIEETSVQQDDIVGLKDGNNYWKFIVEDGELYYITVTEGELVSPGGVGRSLNRVIFEEPTELIIEVKGIKLVKVEKLLKEIIKYTENNRTKWNSNHYVSALVMRELGMEYKAKELMDEWISRFPASISAQWAYAKFNNNNEKAEEILKNLKTESEGTPWNPTGSDPNFKLVIEAMKIIEK